MPHLKTKYPSEWRTSENTGSMTPWMPTSLQASSSIGKKLRHAPNSCQLLRGRDVANTHTHTHTYIQTYIQTSRRSYIRKTALARQLVPPCSRHRSFVPMQSQWHTSRPKVVAMLHRMQLEMKTTSGLHMLYKFSLQSLIESVLLRVCLTESSSLSCTTWLKTTASQPYETKAI
jgi:hypothetical protein